MKMTILLVLILSISLYGKDYTQNKQTIDFINIVSKKHNFKKSYLNELFSEVSLQKTTFKLNGGLKKKQKKGIKAKKKYIWHGSWDRYVKHKVTSKRIQQGVSFIRKHKMTFNKVEKVYGVPSEYIAAIIGIETIYGKNVGKFPVFDTLTTLAFEKNRRNEFFKEQLEEFILQVIKKEIRQIIHSLLQNTKDYQEINFKLIADEMSNLFPVPLDFEEKLKQVALSINKNKELEEKLVEYNFGLAKKFLEEKQRALFSKEPPVLSEDEFVKIQKRLILQIIDYFFQNYLEEMEYFKQGISLRAYGQKDPLDEFRRESLIKFRQLNSAIWHQVAQSILNLNIPRSNKSSLRKV